MAMSAKKKAAITRLRDENRAAEIGDECVCPRCGITYPKKRTIQYSCSNKCGYWLRDNIGSFQPYTKPRAPIKKHVNNHPVVGSMRAMGIQW